MPGKVKVKIIAGRNLPVMDRSADTTDAYVEIKMSNITHKTDVCRKSLNPQWTEEWHRFEVDDTELQDEPLQIRLMDYDVYSANDAIGKVYIDLNPLIHGSLDVPDTCVPQVRAPMLGGAMSYCGWFPVYDTMHGIRGEVQVIVKIELFSDTNKFRDSSHGIKFFCTAGVPHGLHALYIHGFVEELILTEDPEYEWLDKIRTPRATNEARQTLFFKLSGEVKRRVGLKALEMGANSVIGYRLQFDLEGESGIVARGIGTAVTLVSPLDTSPNTTLDDSCDRVAVLLGPHPLLKVASTSCSCLLRPSGSSHSMSPLKPQPPHLLVIPPTPTGSAGVSPTSPVSPQTVNSPFRRHPSYGEAILAIDLVSLGLPAPQNRPKPSTFRTLAKSLRLALTKRFISRKETVREMPKFEVVYPEKFDRRHRRSSSDPFSAGPFTRQLRGALDSVLEESSSPHSVRLRTFQSESCLSPIGSSNNSSIEFVLLPSESVSSVESLESSVSTTSELCLADALRPTDPNLPSIPLTAPLLPLARRCNLVRSMSSSVSSSLSTTSTSATPRNSVTGSCPSRLPFPSAAPPVHGLDSTDSSSYLDDEQQQRLGHSNGSNTLSPSRITNNIQRRSSDSDLSITPKGNSFGSGGSANNRQFHRHSIPRPILNQDSSIDLLEYPFLTLNKYPAGFIIRFGGMVCARSVKLLERNTEEPESRDLWWHELRMEVRSHARALACNVVLGYREESSISDDVCILSATGTAAVVNMHHRDGSRISSRKFKTRSTKSKDTDTSNVSEENEDEKQTSKINIENFNKGRRSKVSLADGQSPLPPQCTMCHVPYSLANSPMPVNAIRCAVCKKGKVPDVLLTTVEIPEEAMLTGRGCLVQVQVCRTKKDAKGEHNAKEISDSLPFLEYDMYSAIINKLRVKGMNAVFNLRVSVTVGDRLLVGIASGTAVFLTPMPAPPIPKLTASKNNNSRLSLAEVQKRLQDACRNNREIYGVIPNQEKDCNSESDSEESDEDLPALELASGNKDACIIEVDDSEDMNAVNLLIESSVPHGFEVVNTETIPGLTGFEVVSSLQMFTQVWRARVNPCQNSSYSFSLNKHIRRLQQSLYFKLRKMVPCGLLRLRFKVELPDADEIQITILGMAVGLGKVPQPLKSAAKLKTNCKKEDSDLIFKLDDEVVAIVTPPPAANIRDKKQNPFYLGYTNLLKNSHDPPTGRYGVDITPLSYVPGAKIEEYLGNLNFFFIRESNSIREIGGYSNFVHGFINELLAIVRAHITALGGNAMVSYYMNEFTLLSAAHKNQGQCLIQVGGDAVRVSYPAAEKQQ
ncbi:C2 domain-containing protein 5 isoform X2 [Neocloeon triangulifer]|uniref:C2 domain-containing protein 5 isoform X2 n=1 Tax=Neocloeon triangulifer TaxID=2078957 RepID=UPI00286F5DDA|nr:C2 domain-containing protein 5 isoform X2 [Neocloeon triangulifer]